MEDQTQKILSLQEEIISLQKIGYKFNLESIKKIDDYRTMVILLLAVALLSLAYALVISFLYFQ